MWMYIGVGVDLRWIWGAFRVDWGRIEGRMEKDWGRSKWLEIANNYVLRFFHFYPLISAFQASSRIPNDRKLNLLSNGAVESFWDAVWLGIEPFLCLYGFR